jgi:hypothetical protein
MESLARIDQEFPINSRVIILSKKHKGMMAIVKRIVDKIKGDLSN